MNASYAVRLVVQCMSSFFVVHLFFSLGVFGLAPFTVRWAERMRPSVGIALLMSLRVLPSVAGFYAACAIVLPSYLRLETDMGPEQVSVWACLIAVITVALFGRPLICGLAAILRSFRFLRHIKCIAQPVRIANREIWIVPEPRVGVAVAGLIRSRVLLSKALANTLSHDELNMVLLHERAHQVSGDNLKRFLLLLLPEPLPFFNFTRTLDEAWKRLAEWAADDHAADGNSERSIALAQALVRFARFRTPQPRCALVTSLVEDHSELVARVQRLLTQQPKASHDRGLLSVVIAGSFYAVLVSLSRCTSLPEVHRLLESLFH